MMSGIRGRDTKPEMVVRRSLHARGLRFRLHDRSLPGRPDMVLPRYRATVLIHGCFWHRHPGCRLAYEPKSNTEFWSSKLARNVERDAAAAEALRTLGWRVFTVWECDLSEARLTQLAEAIRSDVMTVGEAATPAGLAVRRSL
jgi:DNA mismatch endonuclease (patch repair protein)